MIKFIYIGSALLLGLLTVWHYLGNYLIDDASLDNSFRRHLPMQIGIAIVLGSIYFALFKKIFPKGWQQQTPAGKIAVVLIFFILSFVVTRHCSISLNMLLPYRQKDSFEGIVDTKIIEKAQKGTKFYQLRIVSLVNDSVRAVHVSRKIFDQYVKGDTLRKSIYLGPFDIKYMRN